MKRGKMLYAIGVICFLMLNVNGNSSNDLQSIFESQFPGFVVLNYRKGNFTNSKLGEYVVFLKEKQIYKVPTSTSNEFRRDFEKFLKRNNTSKVVVITLNKNTIVKRYDLNIGTLEYDKKDIEIVIKGNPQFGKFDGYCFISDFNKNGLDEILFFELTGMSFLPFIFEFNKNSMKVILNPPPTYSNCISELRTINENDNRMIKILGSGGGSIVEGKRDWYIYSWNVKKQLYEIIERGSEDWYIIENGKIKYIH